MLCKSLRAAAKNDALCRFLNALVRIPFIKYRKQNGQTGVFVRFVGGNESRDVELYAFNKEAKYLLVSPLFL